MVNGKNEKVADFFRTLSRMAVPLYDPWGTATVRERTDAKKRFRNDWHSLLGRTGVVLRSRTSA